MDMVCVIVWASDADAGTGDPAGLRSRIGAAVEGPLAALGVERYLVNVRDEAVAGAMIDVQVTERPLLAVVRARVPVAPATALADLPEGARAIGPVSAWSVTASEPLPIADPTEGDRCEGMSQIAILRRPERIEREQWLRTWLEEHTTVAVDTQSTSGYLQHVVVRALTEDAPRIDAIVEEVLPLAAATDLTVFFGAPGDEARMAANMQAMGASTARFLDDGTVDAIPTGRYVMRIRGPHM